MLQKTRTIPGLWKRTDFEVPGGVEADVEDLATIAGESIVKDGIGIREVDRGSRHNREDVRREHLVLLEHGHVPVSCGRGLVDGQERQHHAGIIPLPRASGFNARFTEFHGA